jgi:hypothetical protein
MKEKLAFAAFALLINSLFAGVAISQRKTPGTICGDPTAPCRTRENFQPYELPFEYGKSNVIAESKPFYAVILKSVKLNSDQSDCENAIPEAERLDVQTLFPHNMVFAMRCWETGQTSYTNVAGGVSFMAVYAGQTPGQANTFLKTVAATGKFKGATLRRMRVMMNGT